MSKKDKERAKRVQAICAEIRNTIFDNDGNAVGKYSDKNIIFDETGTYPIGKNLKDGSVVYFNIYKGKEKHEIKEDKDMENYIVINGKRAELTEEQLEKLGIKTEKNKYEEMFERSLNTDYYIINTFGCVLVDREDLHAADTVKDIFSVGNYCKDKKLMEQRALHETLNRLLWRASIIAGELDNPWDGFSRHYSIYRDVDGRFFLNSASNSCKYHNVIYFPTKESAEDAIENVIKPFMSEHPDFVW